MSIQICRCVSNSEHFINNALPTNQTIIPAASYWQVATQANEKNQRKSTLGKHILLYFILNLPNQALMEYKSTVFEPTVMMWKSRPSYLLGFKSKQNIK